MLGLVITHDTAFSHWDGEQMEQNMANDALLTASGDFNKCGAAVSAETTAAKGL